MGHYTGVIITKEKPNENKIIEIMDPYYLSGDCEFQELCWDYYDILEIKPVCEHDLREAYAIITKYGSAVAKQRWNGECFVNQQAEMEEQIAEILNDPECRWMTIIDYHD